MLPGSSDVHGCSMSQSMWDSDTDLEGKHLWQQDRSHAHRWNYLSPFFMRVLRYLLHVLSKRQIAAQRKKSHVGAVLSVSSCSLLLPTHTPAQTVIMYHEPFGISLFRSVKWNVLLLLLLLFVLFGIPKHVPFQRHRSMNGTIKWIIRKIFCLSLRWCLTLIVYSLVECLYSFKN